MIQSGCVPTKHSKTQVHFKCFRADYGMTLPVSCLCTLLYCNKRLLRLDYRLYSNNLLCKHAAYFTDRRQC